MSNYNNSDFFERDPSTQQSNHHMIVIISSSVAAIVFVMCTISAFYILLRRWRKQKRNAKLKPKISTLNSPISKKKNLKKRKTKKFSIKLLRKSDSPATSTMNSKDVSVAVNQPNLSNQNSVNSPKKFTNTIKQSEKPKMDLYMFPETEDTISLSKPICLPISKPKVTEPHVKHAEDTDPAIPRYIKFLPMEKKISVRVFKSKDRSLKHKKSGPTPKFLIADPLAMGPNVNNNSENAKNVKFDGKISEKKKKILGESQIDGKDSDDETTRRLSDRSEKSLSTYTTPTN